MIERRPPIKPAGRCSRHHRRVRRRGDHDPEFSQSETAAAGVSDWLRHEKSWRDLFGVGQQWENRMTER
jgi:hypothetical protein